MERLAWHAKSRLFFSKNLRRYINTTINCVMIKRRWKACFTTEVFIKLIYVCKLHRCCSIGHALMPLKCAHLHRLWMFAESYSAIDNSWFTDIWFVSVTGHYFKTKAILFFLCQYVYDVNLDAGIVWLACVRDLKVARQFILIQCFPRLCLAQYGGILYTIHHSHIVRCFRTHVLQTKTIINDVLGPFIYVWQWRTTCVPAARLNNAILRAIGRGGLSSYHLRIIRCRRYISSVFILFLGQYNEEIKQFSLFVTP